MTIIITTYQSYCYHHCDETTARHERRDDNEQTNDSNALHRLHNTSRTLKVTSARNTHTHIQKTETRQREIKKRDKLEGDVHLICTSC